ncbi:FRG domain-containing protein [Paenibacillus cucumis (ex Kampfer et al. 2016)]|uniref:FRG domain-containing protein n=1 Tax=Paenibacillus cucumis (ex Kampfer et al. 2016) TaxID=1776858 RepID=A0ABS7KE67_9BACL|nr:FRG domain-containing protein [Paenibacillus cucumis (ex Kampfer et al. 2016)]MBY0202443.1 FRG domain-containing protein [Paenibacillus cucumis (ex Kampfer et al. 2016)]
MYNLFITSQDDAWEKHHYEIDKSRFLEYTNMDISDVFKNAKQDQLDVLKSYPCLFTYEGFEGYSKVGYLEKITDRGRMYLIEYSFDKEIPTIKSSDLEDIALLLDIRGWEINRTHWAIKDEDLLIRLSEANLIKIEVDKNDTVLPDPVESDSIVVESVKSYIEEIFKLSNDQDNDTFYRGHSDKKVYKLVPSLFRKDKAGNYKFLDNENVMFNEMILSNSSDFSMDTSTLDKLVRMQHYSLPTRLLDITSNPLIALYFACSSNGNMNVEGEVIIFKINKSHIKYFDSDKASCISNLAKLSKDDKENIIFEADVEGFNKQQIVGRLLHYIMEEKPFFQPRIVPTDLQDILCIKSKRANSRIYSQSGAFLLFGHEAVMNEEGTEDITVRRITIVNKQKILNELDALNINDSTVFPYIENTAKYIAKKFEFISK